MSAYRLLFSHQAMVGMVLLIALWLLIAHFLSSSRPWDTGIWSLSGVLQPHSKLTVLIWHWPFNKSLPLDGDVCARYGVADCWLSTNRSLLHRANVVVFHHHELQSGAVRLPLAKRPPGQPWVWTNLESPSNTHGLSRYRNIFTWVMSYRRDSDIFVPYGELVPRAGPDLPVPAKNRTAAWVISNYRRTQKRALVYSQLSKYLLIDVFGRASRKPLCAGCLLPTLAPYRFYLAFENSQHPDYITEKLWRNALSAGVVPVVLGPPRATYEAFLPADSFVHVDDFGSVRDLATFLKSVNASHYQRFFAWRKRLAVRLYSDWRERFCGVCARYPHLPQGQVYRDLEAWFKSQ
ncbi:alpha-(1,3)-fucosyltransferase 7 [Monodelphis domestica]|uniref:Fucosyltransferase n=1 Tax=Monodelphis domestica TaxID=13616 RepID=F6T3M3_MONDO|nr:alpha-(1,3)-fucosyltransferase 7 [Monodelphis domestica]